MARPVYTRIVIDMETLCVLECEGYWYDGPWALLKGGNSKAEMQKANDLSQQQLQLQQQQFALQQKQLGMVNPSLQAIIQNQGMLPATEAAMRSQALNNLGSQYQNLYGSLSQSLTARGMTGGMNAGAGGIAANFGALGAQEAGQATQALEGIQLAKAQGLQNALGMGLGEGQMYGQQAIGLGSQGVSALGIGAQAANAADQAQSGFWGSLVGGLAGLGGSAITKYCWVAAELYGGLYTRETWAIRKWLSETWYMALFVFFYKRLGVRWAELIQTRPMLRRSSKLLFDLFLRLADV